MSMPWKIQPKTHTIESDGIEFEILDYGSLLVCELDYLKSMPKELTGNELARQFVAFCLRTRYRDGVPSDATDEQILEGMPVHLLAKVINFMVYGPGGPQVAEVITKAKKPRPLTMANSSGNSSSTTQSTPTLRPKPTRTVPSASSIQPSKSTKLSA